MPYMARNPVLFVRQIAAQSGLSMGSAHLKTFSMSSFGRRCHISESIFVVGGGDVMSISSGEECVVESIFGDGCDGDLDEKVQISAEGSGNFSFATALVSSGMTCLRTYRWILN